MRVAVAVRHGQHAADDAAGDAAVVEREVLEGVEGPVAERAAVARGAARLGVRREGRVAAVGRIDDERRLAPGSGADVVAERAHVVVGARAGLLVALGAIGKLLIGEVEPVAELLRPDGRDAAHVVARPGALQVGVAPRRARRLVADARRAVERGDGQVRRSRLRRGERRRPQRCAKRKSQCQPTTRGRNHGASGAARRAAIGAYYTASV